MNRRTRPLSPHASSSTERGNSDGFAVAAAQLRAQRPLRRARTQQIAENLRHNRTELAEKELSKYLARHPDDADAINLMARVADRLGRCEEAASLLARCLELAPGFAAARFDYAKLLARLHRYDAALGEADQLLACNSDNPLFRQLKAVILGTIGEDAQALALWQQLADENPCRAESWVKYGDALRAAGLQDRSIAAYRRAIQSRPSFGLAWWSLANLKTFRFSDADMATMQEQLKRPDIGTEDRVNLLFCLGKADEDLGDYERSFEQYAKANAARRLRVDYDWDALASAVAANKALFTPEFFRTRSSVGCTAQDPIFILGRPRSGSTLIEQILSSHPAIEGTAELPYIAALARQLLQRECPAYGLEYPHVLQKLAPSALEALGEEYLACARAHRKLGRPFFIDKSPANYHHLGLIRLILPGAKIVDARRHPAACCLSMFKHNYSDTNLRLAELGRVYRDYVELLAHFDRAQPGRIHRVIYEDMVADPEGEIRRLLGYLGLPFEESCLRFYTTDRTIRSPSSEQVRRPISDKAVDHWLHFEPWLTPLIKSLGSVQVAYPSVPEEFR